MTTIYRNKNFTAKDRNYECTNVILQITSDAPRNFNGTPDTTGNWVEIDQQEAADIAELAGTNYPEAMGYQGIGGFGKHYFYGYL